MYLTFLTSVSVVSVSASGILVRPLIWIETLALGSMPANCSPILPMAFGDPVVALVTRSFAASALSAALMVSIAPSAPSIRRFVTLSVSIASPRPPAYGTTTSTISPTNPTQAQGSEGLEITSAILLPNEKRSRTVSNQLPPVSRRDVGLFPQ